MNYYRSGSRNDGGYSDRGWRNQNWNPYAGEEEPIGMDRNRRNENYGYDRREDSWGRERGCCMEKRDEDYGRRQRDGHGEPDRREYRNYRNDDDRDDRRRRDYMSMGMPELSPEEWNNINHWTPCKDWNFQDKDTMCPRGENRTSGDGMTENGQMYGRHREEMVGEVQMQNQMQQRGENEVQRQPENQTVMPTQHERENQPMMPEQMQRGNQSVMPEMQRGNQSVMPEQIRRGNQPMPEQMQRGNQSMIPEQTQRGNQPMMPEQTQRGNQPTMTFQSRPEIALDGGTAVGMRNGMPYQTFDYLNVLEEEEQLEQDFRRLQSMYPQAVQEILPYIEEACDKMEYEGSMMFDEMPDRNMVRQISDGIYEQVRDIYPMENVQEEPDEVLSMQYQGRRRNPPGQNLLNDLIQVMLLQDMHRRRCRHRRCRPHMYR